MNKMTLWLENYFDEVEPKEFYREIFPEGSFQKKGEVRSGSDWVYNGIAVTVTKELKRNGKPKVKRFTVTDDLDVIDELGQTDDFCLMSPISYVGKERTADNARFLYAFTVDLDRMRYTEDGQPIGLENLWNRHIEAMDRIPKPTFIVSSGTGLHLYYVLTEPIALFKDTSKRLQTIKRDLTSMIWDDTIVDIKSVKDIQQEGIYQGFRIPGTITKNGERARAFWTGDKISIESLLEYTKGMRGVREHMESKQFVKKKDVTLKKAKELYPDWYERRIERKEPRGSWHVSRALYDWWKRQIIDGAVVGHRYYCVMMLAIYARKCSMYDEKHNPNPVTKEELESDAYGLLEFMESKTNSEDNHFTTGDIMDALEAFNDKWITYPRNSVEYKSGIRIDANKRNGLKQEKHLFLARRRKEDMKMLDIPLQSPEGRPTKKDIVEAWQLRHPEGRKADCIRDTGLTKPTVYKYWT